MKIIEALKSSVNYPLSDSNVEVNLTSRGIEDVNEDFTAAVAQSKSYRLAYADTLRYIVTMVNLSQSGGSISQASVAEIRGTANAIYKEFGEPLIGEKGDEQTSIVGLKIEDVC